MHACSFHLLLCYLLTESQLLKKIPYIKYKVLPENYTCLFPSAADFSDFSPSGRLFSHWYCYSFTSPSSPNFLLYVYYLYIYITPSYNCFTFSVCEKPYFQDWIWPKKFNKELSLSKREFDLCCSWEEIKNIKLQNHIKIKIKSYNTFKQMLTDDLKIATFLFQNCSMGGKEPN